MTDIRTLRDVVSEYIKDLKEDEDWYTGYINGKETYEAFFVHLRATGYWFVTTQSSTLASEHGSKGAVFFQNVRKGSNLQIPFFGSLYEHVKNSRYECSQGTKRKHDRSNKVCLKGTDLPLGKRRRIRLQPSKKIGCSATMTVWHISVFPDYKIEKYNVHGSEQQTKMAKQLKADIEAGKKGNAPPSSQPKKYDRFVIRLSTAKVHNHPTVSCSMTQMLHPELSTEIASAVKKNICSVQEIQQHLVDYVKRKVEDSVWPAPELLNRCFYPNRTVIYNHMHKAIFELKEKKLDQDKLKQYISYCIPPSDSMFFRPYKEITREGRNTWDETPLLVCHQTSWQKHLLDRYGNDICVLDTYKTTFNNLPLFFLVVKTNVGYLVAGSFIVQSVSSELVEEALRVFLSWNPAWDPLYFMVDLSKSEINAIKRVFPESSVYLCAYYRERAWTHWLSCQDNELPAVAQAAFKHHWDEISSSKTVPEFEENVMIMKNSDEYELHSKVRKYMDKEWLPKANLWVEAFQADDFLTKVNIMNGVDSQRQFLNHDFLKQNADKSLSELVHLVLTDYLPTVLDAYKSAQLLSKHMSPKEECPEFLEDRPVHFVLHVMQRYTTASEEYSANNIASVTESKFAVAVGEARNTKYIVDFDVPSCTCSDFTRWYLPCTHICAIFLYVPGKTFENLPLSYINSPYLTVDHKLQLNDSEHVPMYDNTVTIVAMPESYVSDCADTDTHKTIPVKNESDNPSEAEQVRELLKEMYNQTFLIGNNVECLQSAKPILLAAKLLLAKGIPVTLKDPPPLSRIVKTSQNYSSQCKRTSKMPPHVAKKVKRPNVQLAAVAQTTNLTLVADGRKVCQLRSTSKESTQLNKKGLIPKVQVAAIACTDNKDVPESPPEMPPSTRINERLSVESDERDRTVNQSVSRPSGMPPLLIRKTKMPNKLWSALAKKQGKKDSGRQCEGEDASKAE